MPAPHWFFRFVYDRESAAWERRRDEPEHRELVERTADELANVVAPPGPVADLGCGPGAHAFALARRGYDVVGVDGSPRMVEVARTRAARDKVDATFDVHDVSAPLRFADASLGGVLAILVLQHLPHPASFIAEIRRCLRPGGQPVDHRSRPRRHVAHVPEPVLAAARSVLPPRARRRPLPRHELPLSSSRGPGPDRRRVQRRARSRERVGTRETSLACRPRSCTSRPAPTRGTTEHTEQGATTYPLGSPLTATPTSSIKVSKWPVAPTRPTPTRSTAR
jgi:SAM-dependent methyltransferase